MIIKAVDIVKRYKELIALDHFNLEVEEGEILGLLGPNGSGKTTFINCLLAILKYDSGSISVFRKEFTPSSYDLKRKIGLVPQDLAIFMELTVRENIDYFCGLYVSDNNLRKKLVDEAIDFVELRKYEKFPAKKLSGGLARRLNIACGIAHKPELLILDEPTVAVDAQSRNFILNGIKELNNQGVTIIYTSHYLEEVEMIASRILIMDQGRNVVSGTKEELTNSISISEKIFVKIIDRADEAEDLFKSFLDVEKIDRKDDEFELRFSKGNTNLIKVVSGLNENKLLYSKIHSEEPSLNDVFLEITGRGLRD